MNHARGAEAQDPTLDLLVKKGIITVDEANKAKAEADAMRTNMMAMPAESKWKINDYIKNIELFGDLRFRYERREADTPSGGKLELDRARVAMRLGLRGEAFDDFYYGLRLDTAQNPRSPWVTLGTSTTGVPYQGPYGKSSFNVEVGQVYAGWRPTSWLDVTVGKMANPFYTTSMVWDSDLNPEGTAERFKYTVGQADFFATLGQFVYQDVNPNDVSPGLFSGLQQGSSGGPIFQFVEQIGMNYHFTTNLSAKIAAAIYSYTGIKSNTPPFFGDPYVGEGAYLGPGTGTVDGNSGWNPNASPTAPGFFAGFPNNQGGLNHLLVVEVPWEVNFKLLSYDARVFGDVAYNLEGRERADEAAAGYNNYIALNSGTLTSFKAHHDERTAYQIGFAFGNPGLVNGTTSRKHTWEIRSYWQHVEQYALDPNLLDSDFFEGRGNLEGVFVAGAYSLTDNVIGTIRYGHADRINHELGTGGNNQDIPQINPVQHSDLIQVDLTLRF